MDTHMQVSYLLGCPFSGNFCIHILLFRKSKLSMNIDRGTCIKISWECMAKIQIIEKKNLIDKGFDSIAN